MINNKVMNNKASVAQLAERLPRKQVVGGSNPPLGLIKEIGL